MQRRCAMSKPGSLGEGAGVPARRVAFGEFDHWEESIRQNLDPRYALVFADLSRVRLTDFDAVVPLQLVHYLALEGQPELRGFKFFHPSSAVVALCDDKLKLAQFLIAEGFARIVPQLRSPGAPYPYVWKRRQSWWGLDCHIVKGPDDELGLDLSDGNYFAQELVPGEVEFATYILRTGGEVRYVSTFSHKMGKPVFVHGVQDSPLSSAFHRGCHFLDLFSEILARLDFEGTACFDYKLAGGGPALFEINPRFGGSLRGDVTAYLDAYVASLAPDSLQQRLKVALARLRRRLLDRLR